MASVLPFVSVIVPCRNEERYIAACLDSMLAFDYPAERLEVLVVDGHSDDRTREIVTEYGRRFRTVRLLDNPRRITPCALNTALRAARGEVIVRTDAHATYPRDYVSMLVTALEETGAEIVGPRFATRAGARSARAEAIAVGMSHPFGVGNARFRIGAPARCEVDHVPFFCCRRSLFDRVGLFDEELVRNQDGEFSARVIRHGGRVVLVPEVVAYYVARSTLRQLARMYFQYGYFKLLSARKLGRVMTVRPLIPPLLLSFLVTATVLAPWSTLAAIALLAVLALYTGALLACCAGARGEISLRARAWLALVFPVMHASFGYGYLRRLVEFAARRRTAGLDPAMIPLSR